MRDFARRILKIIRKLIYILTIPKKTKQKIEMSQDEVKKFLYNITPIPNGKIETNNKIVPQIDLSIIVAAYNVEQYIDQCIKSLLQQETKYQYEIIIVNDGSTDETLQKIMKYSYDNRIIIIDQDNKGLSGARNIAIAQMKGKYVTFVDADDYMLPNAIENFLDIAYQKNADIVEGSAFSFFDNGKLSRRFKHKEKIKQVNPVKEFLGYPWGKVYKSKIFEKYHFPEGYLFEDTIFAMFIYPLCKECWTMGSNVYAYRVNKNGITQKAKANKRSIESQWITEYLLNQQFKEKIVSVDIYNQFLDQIAMNYSRSKELGNEVKKALFLENRNLYFKYYKKYKFKPEGYKKRKLEKYLKEGNIDKGLHLLNYWDSL